VHLPRDAKVLEPARGLASLAERAIGDVRPAEAVVDVGVETCLAYREVLCQAATVVHTGQMGAADVDALAEGSALVAQAITTSAERTMAFGARTVALLERLDAARYFRHVSRSGRGALPLFSGTVLPGIESLRSAP
jgi:phosphoglycerate kinase